MARVALPSRRSIIVLISDSGDLNSCLTGHAVDAVAKFVGGAAGHGSAPEVGCLDRRAYHYGQRRVALAEDLAGRAYHFKVEGDTQNFAKSSLHPSGGSSPSGSTSQARLRHAASQCLSGRSPGRRTEDTPSALESIRHKCGSGDTRPPDDRCTGPRSPDMSS